MRRNESEQEKMQELQLCLKHTFTDTNLLRQAMTHSSYAHEYLEDAAFYNERLEFLGDAVLELITSRMLYDSMDAQEGDLSKKRASIVCEPSLAYVAKELGLGRFLRVSHGEEKNGGRRRNSILADFVEALIGAMYLDAGYETAEAFVKRELFSRIKEIEDHTVKDYKSLVQELVQAWGETAPVYKLIRTEGPPHNCVFTTQAIFKGQVVGTGTGRSKKEAEQQAARMAYKFLETSNR